jgi:outer membrane protein TolC
LIHSRQTDPLWNTPERPVEPANNSRLADHNEASCGPLPPDDPAANVYMTRPYNSRKAIKFWDQRGYQATVDNGLWDSQLPLNSDGELELDQEATVQMALLNSRDYQNEVEQLYATALDLSGNQFEFDLNWFGGTDTALLAQSDGFNATRDLSTVNQLGVTRNLAAGGQLATSLLNSFTWDLGGAGPTNFSAGNILVSLTQPLLRGAFRHVRTESLTQSERNLLYSARDFARFRRQFYLSNVSAYLNLLNQAQSVRIDTDNLSNLELNLEEHNVLLERDLVSPIQVDQVFQQYQSGRLSLINSQQSLQTAMDQFKFDLGLPARIKIKLDESILDPFTLNSGELETLQESVEELEQSLVEYLPPDVAPDEFIENAYTRIKQFSKKVKDATTSVREELTQWDSALGETPSNTSDAEKIDFEQQRSLIKRLEELFDDLEAQDEDAEEQFKKPLEDLELGSDEDDQGADDLDIEDADAKQELTADQERIAAWKKLQLLIAQPGGIKDRVNSLFVAQTQIRLFLIEIKPLELETDRAVEIALSNRLDLKNAKGFVVDAYRQVEVAADQLESDLSVTASANLRTDDDRDNAFRIDSENNEYNVGLEFDGPLNRFNERNSWRLAEINYQSTRRAYMEAEDGIVNQVRLDLRQLRTNRFNFQIARQQLITATRQVEQAQFNLRTATTGDSSLTQDLLQALQSLRDTKTQLISSWIQYETSRIAIFVDLELLQLDEQGNWINEEEDFKTETVVTERFVEDGGDETPSTGSGSKFNDGFEQPTELDGPSSAPSLDGPAVSPDSISGTDTTSVAPAVKEASSANARRASAAGRRAGNLSDLR